MEEINDYTSFVDRNGRRDFLIKSFSNTFNKSNSILDVGCSDNELKEKLGDKVFGIDLYGKPDKKIDLEKDMLSYFSDNSYDTIVCTEVLEHIDTFYEVLDDLFRVAKKNVIISLPNCLNIWVRIQILFTGKIGKFYGLQNKKSDDRHKWIFDVKDIDIFFDYYSKKNNYTIKMKIFNFNYTDSMKGRILKVFLRLFSLKLFSSSYFILIKK